jgi:hypothetical protein
VCGFESMCAETTRTHTCTHSREDLGLCQCGYAGVWLREGWAVRGETAARPQAPSMQHSNSRVVRNSGVERGRTVAVYAKVAADTADMQMRLLGQYQKPRDAMRTTAQRERKASRLGLLQERQQRLHWHFWQAPGLNCADAAGAAGSPAGSAVGADGGAAGGRCGSGAVVGRHQAPKAIGGCSRSGRETPTQPV